VQALTFRRSVALPAELGPEFSNIIKTYGQRWGERVRQRLEPYFPRGNGEAIAAYIWAHTIPCPTTGWPTPLAPDFWLARGNAGRDIAVALKVDRAAGTYSLAIVDGPEAKQWGNRSTYKQGGAESIWTGETFAGDYIQRMSQQGHMGQMLLALSVTSSGSAGRYFRTPMPADLKAITAAEAELQARLPAWDVADLVPTEPIDSISNYNRGHRMYGINRWCDFFTSRQLLTNVTALDELRGIVAEAREDLGDERSRALALYLALALDKSVDYNSRQCSWHSTRTTVRSTFDKHNFNFKWSFAEFDGAHSLLQWAVSQVENAYDGMARLAYQAAKLDAPERRDQARITRGSALSLSVPDASVDAIVTDPPYYDNVMYAECSDYFYVWLKRSLRDTWPEFADLVLTEKQEEIVANPALFRDVAAPSSRGRKAGQGKTATELADGHYEDLLKRSFRESARVLKPDGVLTVMFTHKRVDAWDTLGAALLDAGFAISASWPVHTESEHSLHQAKKNAASSTILLACHKRTSSEPAYWADIRRNVELAAEEAAHRFSALGITGVDLTIATYGPVLSVLSSRWPVYSGDLDDDGNPRVLRPDTALDLARERVATLKKRGLLGGKDVDFDRVTDWWLLAWNDFKGPIPDRRLLHCHALVLDRLP